MVVEQNGKQYEASVKTEPRKQIHKSSIDREKAKKLTSNQVPVKKFKGPIE